MGGKCPFGRGHEIDSAACRQCPDYFRAGTAMFFWCRQNMETTSPMSMPDPAPRKRTTTAAKGRKKGGKRGRPRKTAVSGPNKARKTKNG